MTESHQNIMMAVLIFLLGILFGIAGQAAWDDYEFDRDCEGIAVDTLWGWDTERYCIVDDTVAESTP